MGFANGNTNNNNNKDNDAQVRPVRSFMPDAFRPC